MAEQISKMEAVRRALKEMGRDAMPAQMQPYIKQHFGHEMTTGHISTYKGDILRKRKGGRKPAAEGTAPEEGAGRTAVVRQKAAPAGGKEGGIPLDDILYVKGLVGRFGPAQLHTLIDAFAR